VYIKIKILTAKFIDFIASCSTKSRHWLSILEHHLQFVPDVFKIVLHELPQWPRILALHRIPVIAFFVTIWTFGSSSNPAMDAAAARAWNSRRTSTPSPLFWWASKLQDMRLLIAKTYLGSPSANVTVAPVFIQQISTNSDPSARNRIHDA
jgi:hypothetical protein